MKEDSEAAFLFGGSENYERQRHAASPNRQGRLFQYACPLSLKFFKEDGTSHAIQWARGQEFPGVEHVK
jgi:hypothetical protein